MTRQDRVRGALFGAAFGDALGAPVEFITDIKTISARSSRDLASPHARVTDDTQMMLAVGEALQHLRQDPSATFEAALRQAFVAWFHDPENTRAPGQTCLLACERLQDASVPWWLATERGSKGSGATMRVQPVGLLPAGVVSDDVMAAAAQFQAALTHAHPTALVAADLTAMTLRLLLGGMRPKRLIAALLAYAHKQQVVYHEGRLGALWEHTLHPSPAHFIGRGWAVCLGLLEVLEEIVRVPCPLEDPCLRTGDGWTAETAFATALHALVLYPDQPRDALWRAVVTRGDSDSIACLTGAFVGALHGSQAWPQVWFERIEYHQRIEALVAICEAGVPGFNDR